jgi:xanthine/uracil permease
VRRRSPLTSLVLVLLLVNALPAFVVLQTVPNRTKDWFVWTIQPDANARVLGVMYGNAFLLAAVAWLAPSWLRMRVTMAVVVPFSVAATIVTLVTLDPFRKHPWYELAYWLVNYGILFVAAPLAAVIEERISGGRVPTEVPLSRAARIGGAVVSAALLAYGVSLLFELSLVSSLWPFAITPLVSRILGVWLASLGIAHAFAAWDGDRLRALPLLVASPVTGVLLALVPLIHRDDVRRGAHTSLALYLALAAGLVLFGLLGALGRRDAVSVEDRVEVTQRSQQRA